MKIQVQMYKMKTKLGQQWLLLGSYVTKDESHNRKRWDKMQISKSSGSQSKRQNTLNYNFNKMQTYTYLFIYSFIYLLETPDISCRVKPKNIKFPSKFVKHFKKFLNKFPSKFVKHFKEILNVFWRAPYMHEYCSSKLSDIASTPQEWTPKDLMLIAYFLGVGGIYAYTLKYLLTYQYIGVWFPAVGNITHTPFPLP